MPNFSRRLRNHFSSVLGRPSRETNAVAVRGMRYIIAILALIETRSKTKETGRGFCEE